MTLSTMISSPREMKCHSNDTLADLRAKQERLQEQMAYCREHNDLGAIFKLQLDYALCEIAINSLVNAPKREQQ